MASDRTFQVFVIVTTIGYLAGFILLLIWWRSYRSTKTTTRLIRDRLLPEGEQLRREQSNFL